MSRVPETDVKQCLMRPLQRRAPRQTSEFRNHSEISNGGQLGHIRVVFRHVADNLSNLADVCPNIQTENANRSVCWCVKAEECTQERRLARAIRSEQTDGAARKTPAQVLQDRTSRQCDGETFEF